MFSLWVINERGEQYELTHQQDKFIVSEVEGLGYPVNNINISPAVNVDGGRYNSAHLNTRNIVITVHFVGYNIETRRHELYKMLPAKSKVKVMYKCKERHVYTEGYVENIDVPIFVKHEIAQISILCPDAYWHDFVTISGQTSYSLAMFKFPEGFPEEGETVSVRFDNPVCRMVNRGDAAVGFHGKITIETDTLPTLYMLEQQESPQEKVGTVYLPFPAVWYPDGDRYIVILHNGVKITSGFTQAWVTYGGTTGRDMMLEFSGGLNVGDTISAETRETYQGRSEREYSSDWQSWQAFRTDYSGPYTFLVPSWYAGGTETSVVMTGTRLISGEPNPDTIHNVPATRWSWEIVEDGGEEFIAVTYSGYDPFGDNETVLRVTVTGDEEVTKERVVHRKIMIVSYPDRFYFSPEDCNNFDITKDRLRLYMADTELSGWRYESAEISTSPGVNFECVWLPTQITSALTEQFIYSAAHDIDIRSWTDQQLNEGLQIVDGLRITNTTTGEYLDLSGRQFRNHDVIELNTVPGDLYITLTESFYSTPGESLLYAFSGAFFKFQPGANILEITANTNIALASGEFDAQQLWAGV